ncbi:MAG: hypothetical protein MPK06_01335 [Alphaproteobacteria bacterium]|nr:hypothetical protein [Alphaproteobacteria bacterium]MDA8003846.1 hypothetical protein [Alphaproteobacteria bacterium]MDA8005173.1 hypothetical protein [Alphaproteobacteria bacterium]MDA8012635.1 hypothetical protein [Alphaproteobacteria bacterium]
MTKKPAPSTKPAAITVSTDTEMQLHILAGEKSGAEMPLSPTRYSIGSGRGDDIRIAGDGVSEKHISAVFADNTLTLLSARGAVFAGTTQVTEFPHDINAGEVVTLGAAAFTFGAAGRELPEVPDITAALSSPSEQKSRRGKLAVAAGSMVVLVMAALGAAAFWLSSPAAEESSAEMLARVRTGRVSTLQSALNGDASFRRVRLEITPAESSENSLATLTGVVSDTDALAKLREQAEKAAGETEHIRVRVRTLAQINAEIENSLRLAGASLAHEAAISGTGDLTLRVSGVVPDDLFAARVRRTLEADAPFVDSLTLELTTPDTLTARIDRNLMRADQFSQVHVHFADGALVAEGFLFADAVDDFETLVKNATADLPFDVPLRMEATRIPSLPGQVRGVLLGPNPVARLENADGENLILREGDMIAGRYLVRRIESSGLLLEYEGESVRLSVTAAEGGDDKETGDER